jgi:hypothetical protein
MNSGLKALEIQPKSFMQTEQGCDAKAEAIEEG